MFPRIVISLIRRTKNTKKGVRLVIKVQAEGLKLY